MSHPLLRLLADRAGQVTLGLTLGGLALSLALWGVPVSDAADAIAAADLSWLLVVAVIFLLQQTLRAWRQAIILRCVSPEHTFRTSLSVLCVSFFLINTLPARIGELSRPLLLLERDGTPLSAGFAMVVLERAVDLLATFTMLAMVAWLVETPSQTLVIGETVVDWVALGQKTASMVLPFAVLGLAGLFFAGRSALVLLNQLAAVRLLGHLVRPLVGFAEGFVTALEAARSRAGSILALTAVIWGLTGLMYPPLAAAFGVGDLIGYGEGIGVLCVTMLATIIPSAPGFAGTYEAAFRAAVGLFGVSGGAMDAVAVGMALTFHWWVYGVQSLTAIVFLVLDRIRLTVLLERLSAQMRSSHSA
ncbi:MAG: lysylphosphatidylglycerol synthase transmembrane domain-containing protein [Myxococcota bacterium]|nr:lysylphosphatidylglycerol synthase transmembrane domain-containing protein [Myxococcota bacterium]